MDREEGPEPFHPMKQNRVSPLTKSIVVVAVVALTGAARADISTWLGNTSANWADSNWTGTNNPPIDFDSLVFGLPGTAGSSLTNNLTPLFNVAGITFNPDAGAYTFAGNAITLAGPVVNNSSNVQTINFDMTLNDLQTFSTSGTGGDLRLGGVISGFGSISKLSTAAAAPFGTLFLASTQNTYTGETIFGPGTINVASIADYGVPSSVGARTADMENSSLTGISLHFRGGTLQYTGTTAQSTNRQIRILNGEGATIEASGATPNATLSFTHSGDNINLFDTAGVRTLTLAGTNTGNNSFSIRLTDQAASQTSLRKAGPGTWVLPNSDNTYTGETIIAGGILNVASVSDYGVPSTIGARTLAQENTTVTGVSLHFQGGTLQYTGSTPQSTNRNIRILNGNGATIDASGSNPNATLRFTKTGPNINLFDTGGQRTLTLTGTNTGNNSFSILLANQAGNATHLTKSGPGTWVLNGPDTNSATGTTAVNGGTLVLAKAGGVAVSGPLTIGDSINPAVVLLGGTGNNQIANSSVVTLFGTGPAAGVLRMSNQTEIIAGLVSFDGGIVENEAGTLGTGILTVDVPAATSHTFVGILRDGDGSGTDGFLSLNKMGPGGLILAGNSTYTGVTNIIGGTLTIDGSISGTAVTVANATLDGVGSVGGTVAINNGGIVSSTGAITGTVSIANGGLLAGSSTINGTVNAASGSRISPSGGVLPGTLTIGALNLVNGAILDYEFGTPSSDLINVTTPGGLNLGGGSINLFDTGGVVPLSVNSTYVLFDYAGALTGSLSNLTIANSQVGKFYSLTDDTTNTRITLTVADTTVTEWNGSASTTWSTAGNWTAGTPNAPGAVAKLGPIPTAATTIAVDGPKTVGGILFDNPNSYTVTGAAGDTLTLSNGVAAASITVSSGNHTVSAPIVLATSANATTATGTTLTLSGPISGTRSLIVSGTGTTVLTGANTYAGTTINSGTLTIGNGGTTGSLGTGDVIIAPAAALVFNRSDNITISNNILGGGALLTKLGAGVLTLTGSNTFSTEAGAAFNINAGTVRIGGASALANGVRLNFNGGSLDLNGNNVTAGSLAGTAGSVSDSAAGAGTTTLTINQGSDTTYSGTIANGPSRAVAVTKAGTGVLTLTGNNTFTGLLTINQGAVIAAGDGASVPIASNVTLGDGTNNVFLIAGAASQQFGPGTVITFNNGARDSKLMLRGSNQTVAGLESTAEPSLSLAIIQNDEVNSPGYVGDPGPAILTINATTDHVFGGLIRNQAGGGFSLVKEGPATQEIRNILVQTNNYTSATVNAGKLVFNFTPNANFTHTIPATTALIANSGGTLAFDGSPVVDAVISGNGTIVKQGPGSARFNAVNTFTNGFTLNEGTLEIGNDLALGDPASPLRINGGNVRAAGAAREVPNPVIVNNNFVLGRLTNLNGGLTLAADATITANNPDGAANNPSNVSAITGNFRVSFAEGVPGIGTGAIVVTGNNTNSGGTAMLSGRVNVVGSLSNASLTVNGGELNLNNAAQEVTSLAGTDGRINLTAGHILTVTQSSNTVFSGTLGNSGTLVKAGAGTLALGGDNTAYFGNVDVNAGTLLVTGNLGGSLVTVAGGKFGGTGGVGSVTVNSGVLAPGLSPGILTTGSVFLNGGSLEFEINGLQAGVEYDQINVFGSISLTQNIPISLTLSASLNAGDTFTLFNNDELEPVETNGLLSFNGNPLSQDEQFTVGSQAFTISYMGGLDNNDIVIVAVPEPGSAAALIGGLAALVGLRRRKR